MCLRGHADFPTPTEWMKSSTAGSDYSSQLVEGKNETALAHYEEGGVGATGLANFLVGGCDQRIQTKIASSMPTEFPR